jgi:hypothetical protein
MCLMSEGGLAFPHGDLERVPRFPGMTVLDVFGACANPGLSGLSDGEIADLCLAKAKAMISRRPMV